MPRSDNFFRPIPGNVLPRFAGMVTFMRLPHVPIEDALDVDIGLFGVPWDGGTTLRPGARLGPRQVREMSVLMRNVNPVSKVAPYELARCADLGDVPVNPIDFSQTLQGILNFVQKMDSQGITPCAVGGDHLISLPVLRAIARKSPLGMVHFDAHSDTSNLHFGTSPIGHGTMFRRAVEEGLLDPNRVVQIGIRGGLYANDALDWPLQQGIRIIGIDEFHQLGIAAVVVEALRVVGDGPTYLSFDVDALDPSYAPGTGTPEIGGLTTLEALQVLRGLRSIDWVGADVVEVSPPFDPCGNTALVAATIQWEALCLLAEARARRRRSAQEIRPTNI